MPTTREDRRVLNVLWVFTAIGMIVLGVVLFVVELIGRVCHRFPTP